VQVANFADIFTGRLLSEIPDALTHLLTSLLALPELHTVNLSDNAFGLNTVAPLQPFLSQHVPLQHLILNNNGLVRMARQCPILRLSSAVATDWRTAP
jgi:Ran GTPase-activating protein 1